MAPPDIPTFVNDEAVHAGPTAQMSPGAMGQAGAALAEGAARVGNTMQEFNTRYVEAQRAADAANVMADVSQKLGDASFRWSKTPNRQDALTGYTAEASQIRKDTIGKISDPLMAPLVAREFDSESAMRAIDTGSNAFKLESNKRVADLNNNMLSYANSYASADSDGVKAKIHDSAIGAIRMNVAGGWLSPEEGQIKEKEFGSQTQEVMARKSYNDALSSQYPDKADHLSVALGDPNQFQGLLPEKREILQQRADQLSYRLQSRAASTQAHEDAVADRNQKRQQSHNEAKILGQVWGGKTIDPVQLQNLGDSGQISTAGMEAIHSASVGQSRGADDAATVVRLWHQVDSGQVQPDDIYAQLGKGVSSETGATMVRALDAKGASGSAAERGAFGVLKTAMNGQAIESGSFGGDKGPAVQAWSQAQGEWHARVTIGQQDPTNVLNDMMLKYAHAAKPTWLPQPQLGAVNSFADLQTVARATRAALDAGTINPGQAEKQGQLLKQYQLYYRAPPPKGAPGKPITSGASP